LYPLFAPLDSLAGVGPSTATLLDKLKLTRVRDLAFHLPSHVIERAVLDDLGSARSDLACILEVEVLDYELPPSLRRPMRVQCVDRRDRPITLVFFSNPAGHVQKSLPRAEKRIVAGQLELYGGRWQMVHPEFIVRPERLADIPVREPVYPLTEGLSNKRMRSLVALSLARLPVLAEWHDPALLERRQWLGWAEALRAVHADPDAGPARDRLAYDELLANQLALALLRRRARAASGRALDRPGDRLAKLHATLPFTPTAAQTRCSAEITADLGRTRPMLRLLQGDVGSGKTLVALMAMALAADSGAQSAMLAPTEILARQHAATLEKLATPAGLRVAVLTARDKGRARAAILDGLADGRIDIVVGTHALLNEEVRFRSLGLVVVDEQHRFGVHQRLGLMGKAEHPPHLLVMTATPIPRTLTLTVYGELDVSRIDERPPGRTPVETRIVALDRLEEVYDGIGRAIGQGARIYWVCPLVEASELVDLAAAEDRAAVLRQRFGARVGLVHGRMKAADKDAVMTAFAGGALDILVATTVIEVGVDVPEASVMVIEHAERFGLAQLHQLRGRVGRGHAKSVCLLLRGDPLGETARARLAMMRETDDGFRIAEADLALRGAGDLLGVRQSGLPDFLLVDPARHADLLAMAHDDARLLIECDPTLRSDRGEAARVLLYLFERDSAAGLLRSG
jgi:ATP-dependent DNA helicase RecG